MEHNVSVVVNYKESQLFTKREDPDAGYLQITRSGEWVFITVDGKAIGVVPVDEFARIGLITEGK